MAITPAILKEMDKVEEIDDKIASLEVEINKYKEDREKFGPRYGELLDKQKNGTITSGEREELREYEDKHKNVQMITSNSAKIGELEDKKRELERQKKQILKSIEDGQIAKKEAIEELASAWKQATKGKFAVKIGTALRGKTPTKKAIAKKGFNTEQLTELKNMLSDPAYIKGGAREGKKFSDFEKYFSSKRLIDSRIEKEKKGISI